jgi:hypothetical protein
MSEVKVLAPVLTSKPKDKAFKYRHYANIKLSLDDGKRASSERRDKYISRSSEFPLGMLSRDLAVENSIIKPANLNSFTEYMEMDNPIYDTRSRFLISANPNNQRSDRSYSVTDPYSSPHRPNNLQFNNQYVMSSPQYNQVPTYNPHYNETQSFRYNTPQQVSTNYLNNI